MNPIRRGLVAAFALLPFAPLAARAADAPQYTELDTAQPTESGDKIDVVEFFWYGCPHCYAIEPMIESWAKKLPPDVYFHRIPAVFNSRWGHDAAIFYAFEALGVLDRLNRPFFDAIHRDHLDTMNPDALHQWLKGQGVDPDKFDQTVNSFGVQSKVRRAAQLSLDYKIEGTPEMAVAGRYTVSAEQGRTREGMLRAVDYLIAKVRDSRK